MMTSAPTYPAAGFPTSALSDGCGAGDDGVSSATATTATATDSATAHTSLSLRLVKRPHAGQTVASDPCKKRRKQSTPIRISTGGTLDDMNGSVGEGKLGPFLPSSPDQSPDGTPAPAPTTHLHVGLSQFSTDEHLLSHVKIEDAAVPPDCASDRDVAGSTAAVADSPADSPVNLSGGQNFPPWMSDVHAKSDDWLGAASFTGSSTAGGFGSASGSATAVYLSGGVPHYGHGELGLPAQSRSAGQPPIRIFNPDAYCELCNKEFCNKYFLKTHKANKHRIYSDPPVNTLAQTPMPDTPPALTVNVPNFSAPTFKRAVLTPGPSSTPALAQIQDNSSAKNNDVGKPPTTFPPLFCDLCAKSFCNRKMLKTHRATAHGFMPEYDQCQDSGDSERANTTLEDEHEQPDANTSEDDNLLSKEATSMRNGHAIKEETVCESDETSSNAQQIQIQSQQHSHSQTRDTNDYATNRLRRLGIMNPEAFCEICCKEYCNKYFLRTHKMKRHGILIPDDNSKDNQKDFKLELSISNSWYQIQTSPLNLIMAEQSTNSSGSCGERKSSPVNENECDICGMRFQTVYLAQLHAAAAHCRPAPTSAPAPPAPPLKQEPETTNDRPSTVSDRQLNTTTTDSISEDLQKLQTMILQLNDLDVSRVGGIMCHLCNRELENKYYLHGHMMTEHGILLEEGTEQERQDETECTGATTELVACKLCGRDGFTADALKQHMIECRGAAITQSMATASIVTATDTKDDSNGFINSDKTINRNQITLGGERRASVTLTPTSSYCDICNKELCNKYFMKTHMQRMHGIEIENGAQIGGVVCNICNKELCSKYFLRVHKHNTHGIVEEGTGTSSGTAVTASTSTSTGTNAMANPATGSSSGVTSVHHRQPTELDASQSISEQSIGPTTDVALKPTDLSDLNHRYFTYFTEVCSICGRRFRSTKWLKAHLLGDHGKAGADKWSELEAQLQQSFGQHARKPAPTPDRSTSPATLRIPNGGSVTGTGTAILGTINSGVLQDSTNTVKHGVSSVFSTLFSNDDTNVKQYHCSFCSFSTPVLAFLFVHEKSHAPPPSGTDTDGVPLQCAVCNQTFRQPDQLHHHVMSQHPFLSLGSFFSGMPQPAQFTSNETRTDNKQETSELTEQKQQQQQPQQQQQQQIEHRCTKCTQSSRSRKQSRSAGRHTELAADVSSTLKDVSKQSQLPATYALPQRQQQQTKYVMQAFLMDEPLPALITGTTCVSGATSPVSSCDMQNQQQQQQQQQQQRGGGSGGCGSGSGSEGGGGGGGNSGGVGNGGGGSDRRFAPSIVFLPVLERLTGPLTVSFTLTPA